MDIISSTFAAESLTFIPKDITKPAPNKFPYTNTFLTVQADSPLNTSNVQTTNFDLKKLTKGLKHCQWNGLFLKCYLPDFYSYSPSDKLGFCDLIGLKLINNMTLYMNNSLIEAVQSEVLIERFLKYYQEDFDYYKKELLKDDDRIKQYQKLVTKTPLVRETEINIPLLFNIFLGNDPVKLDLFVSANIQIIIKFNPLSTLLNYSPSYQSKVSNYSINFKKNELLLNLIRPTSFFTPLNPDQAFFYNKPAVTCLKYNNQDKITGLEIPVKELMTNQIDIYLNNGFFASNNKTSKLFFGNSTQTSIKNNLNTLIGIQLNNTILANQSNVQFNLKTGLFNNGLATLGNYSATLVNPDKYLVSITENGIVYSILLVSNNAWNTLLQNIYFCLSGLSSNYFYSMRMFDTLFFAFGQYDLLYNIDTSITDAFGNIKACEGLFVDATRTQIVQGFVDYVINQNVLNERLLALFALLPADPSKINNVFSFHNCLYLNDPNWVYFDLDKEYKYEESLKLKIDNFDTPIEYDNTCRLISNSKKKKYSTLSINFDYLNSGGFYQVDSGNLRIDFQDNYYNDLNNYDFDINQFLLLNLYYFNIAVLFNEQKLIQINNGIIDALEKTSTTVIGLAQQLKNYIMKTKNLGDIELVTKRKRQKMTTE